MILDSLLSFSLTAGDVPTVTAVSGNILDLHMAGIPVLANLSGARDIGIGDDPALKLLVQVTATFAGGTSLQVTLQGATDNGSGSPNAFSAWWSSPVYALATLVQGARLYDMDMPRPPQGIAVPRFLRLSYITVGTHTAGALFAAILLDRPDQMYQSTSNAVIGGYPPGIAIAN